MKTLHTILTVAVALAVTTSGLSAQETKGAKFDAKKIVGSWNLEKGMKAGTDSDEAMLGEVHINKEELRLPTPDGEFVMAYKIDASKSPAHIDIEITAGPAEGSETKGIIGMKDGKLMLCYHPMGGERPTAFESNEDNGNYMFVMAPAKMAAEDLIGSWNYTAGQRAGEEVDEARLGGGEVTVDKEAFHVPAGGDGKFVMKYSLNTDHSPAHIDLEISEGPAPEGKALGIIRISGDEMMFCYDPTGQTRPKSFDTSEDNGFFMFKLKKSGAKKEADK